MFLEGKTLELMIAAVVALVVVGPKDLPILLRRFGQFMARLRGMAAEFRASFDEMARQSELDELRKEVDALRRGQLAEMAAAGQAPEITQTVEDIHQSLAEVGVQLHPPMSHQFPEPAASPAAVAIPSAEPAPAKPKAPRTRKASAKTATSKSAAGKAQASRPRAAPRPRAKKSGPAS